MASKTICFRLQDAAWHADILDAIASSKERGTASCMTLSDWLNKLIAAELNHVQRSRKQEQTHIYQPGDVRNGRPTSKA